MCEYVAVWGDGRTAVEAGVLGTYASREEARARVAEFLRDHADNPAVGAWVVEDRVEE
jgi:hypothetical protein